MASTPVTAGTVIKPSSNGLNDLFTRINTIRANQLTAAQNAGESTTGLATAFATNIAVTGQAARASNVSTLKTDIDAVAASAPFVRNNRSVATAITVPSVGALIKATDFNAWNTVITNMEGVCAHYSRYSSHYSSRYDSHYGGHYSSHYGHYSSHYGHYSHYSHYGRYGHYSSHYSRYGHYSKCLLAGSKVLLANGLLKNIEDILENELIFSWNITTNKKETEQVIKLQKHDNLTPMIKIYFNNNSSLSLTPGHPIFTKDGWKSKNPDISLAIHNIYTTLLNIGDTVLGLNHKELIITKIEELKDDEYECYNLMTNNNHNFIVVPEEETHNYTINNNIIVHNARLCVDGIC